MGKDQMEIFRARLHGIVLLQCAHFLQKLGILEPDERTYERRGGLDRAKAEHGCICFRMAGVIHASEGLRAILEHQDSVAFGNGDERVHVHAAAKKMRDHNGARFRRNRGFHRRNLRREFAKIQIQRNGNQTVFPRNVRHFANGESGHKDFAARQPSLSFQEQVEASAHREGNQHWLVQCKSATDLCFGFCRVARENAPQHSGSKVPPPNVQLFPRIQQ